MVLNKGNVASTSGGNVSATVISKMQNMTWLRNDNPSTDLHSGKKCEEKMWMPLPAKEKKAEGPAEKKSKKKKKQNKQNNNQAGKSIAITHKGGIKSEDSKSTEMTTKETQKPLAPSSIDDPSTSTGGGVWTTDKNVADSLFPNVASPVIAQMSEEEQIREATAASLQTAFLESCRLDEPELPDKTQQVAERSDDEEWGKVRRNLPEPKKECQNSDANNNSGGRKMVGIADKRDEKIECSVDTKKAEDDKGENGDEKKMDIVQSNATKKEGESEDSVTKLPRATANEYDFLGRYRGLTESHMFMGKGARKKEQVYLRQNENNSCRESNRSVQQSTNAANYSSTNPRWMQNRVSGNSRFKYVKSNCDSDFDKQSRHVEQNSNKPRELISRPNNYDNRATNSNNRDFYRGRQPPFNQQHSYNSRDQTNRPNNYDNQPNNRDFDRDKQLRYNQQNSNKPRQPTSQLHNYDNKGNNSNNRDFDSDKHSRYNEENACKPREPASHPKVFDKKIIPEKKNSSLSCTKDENISKVLTTKPELTIKNKIVEGSEEKREEGAKFQEATNESLKKVSENPPDLSEFNSRHNPVAKQGQGSVSTSISSSSTRTSSGLQCLEHTLVPCPNMTGSAPFESSILNLQLLDPLLYKLLLQKQQQSMCSFASVPPTGGGSSAAISEKRPEIAIPRSYPDSTNFENLSTIDPHVQIPTTTTTTTTTTATTATTTLNPNAESYTLLSNQDWSNPSSFQELQKHISPSLNHYHRSINVLGYPIDVPYQDTASLSTSQHPENPNWNCGNQSISTTPFNQNSGYPVDPAINASRQYHPYHQSYPFQSVQPTLTDCHRLPPGYENVVTNNTIQMQRQSTFSQFYDYPPPQLYQQSYNSERNPTPIAMAQCVRHEQLRNSSIPQYPANISHNNRNNMNVSENNYDGQIVSSGACLNFRLPTIPQSAFTDRSRVSSSKGRGRLGFQNS